MSNKINGKSPAQSVVESRYLVMPGDANHYGTAFGGAIVSWIDMVASMSAQKHAGKEAVTASIDTITFREPIKIGDHVVLRAIVTYVGKTSMEIEVDVSKEDVSSGNRALATTANLTFVALDKNKQPTEVPQLVPETTEDRQRFQRAQMRVQSRKELRAKMKEL